VSVIISWNVMVITWALHLIWSAKNTHNVTMETIWGNWVVFVYVGIVLILKVLPVLLVACSIAL